MDQEVGDRITRGQELLEKVATVRAQIQPYAARSVHGEYQALRDEYYSWDEFNETLLRQKFSTGKVADSYRGLVYAFGSPSNELAAVVELERDITRKMRSLGSIRDQLSLYKSAADPATEDGTYSSHLGDKIFIVHGHDGDTKQQVADFVRKITGEQPLILHEQADSGRTIIEKFEEHASEVGFAIILLTADDEGKAKGATQLNPRARQNVVFELGYFMGKLGRSRVVAVHESGVELPSDISGLLYKQLTGNWKMELAGEINAAGIEIDLRKALH